jgi:hypothetical protein
MCEEDKYRILELLDMLLDAVGIFKESYLETLFI